MPYETLHTKRYFHGRAFNVRRDERSACEGLRRPGGFVDHVGAVRAGAGGRAETGWLCASTATRLRCTARTTRRYGGAWGAPMGCARREIRERRSAWLPADSS